MRSPAKRTSPELAWTEPTRQEKRVVFPAPLGPMTPKISPSETAKSTPDRASSPSKRFTSPSTWRTASAGIGDRPRNGARQGAPEPVVETEQALRLEEHHQDEHPAVEEEVRVPEGGARQQLDLEVTEEEPAEDRPRDRPQPADDRHQDDREG